jgi:hypothetical protein
VKLKANKFNLLIEIPAKLFGFVDWNGIYVISIV